LTNKASQCSKKTVQKVARGLSIMEILAIGTKDTPRKKVNVSNGSSPTVGWRYPFINLALHLLVPPQRKGQPYSQHWLRQ